MLRQMCQVAGDHYARHPYLSHDKSHDNVVMVITSIAGHVYFASKLEIEIWNGISMFHECCQRFID